MASGKPIGEYSLKFSTMTYSPGPAGSVLNQVNWEGTATGFGAVFGTATFVGGIKDGTFSWYSQSFMDDGGGLTAVGQGAYESTGKHKWHTETHLQISDGRRISSEGEIDLAARSWKGKTFEN
jgi:hypothetical protein